VLGLSQIGSVWTLLVGFFLLQNAGQSAQAASVQRLMSGLTAADAIIPNSPMVSAESSLREFANAHIIGNAVTWKKYLVTDAGGKLTGEILVDDIKTVPTNDWWDVSVQSLTRSPDDVKTITSDTPLLEVINLLNETVPALAVVKKEDGALMGLLEKSSIVQRLQQKTEAEPA